LLGMNKEKYIHHQQQNWLSGTTGCNVATVPALNHRLELFATILNQRNWLNF
jgi:hypothetical protein